MARKQAPRLEMTIVGHSVETPDSPAIAVCEDATHWWVECDGGCGRTSVQGKWFWKPVDCRNPHDYLEVTRTAPSKWRCGGCGPFPRSAR
jgi:hypothetical protein